MIYLNNEMLQKIREEINEYFKDKTVENMTIMEKRMMLLDVCFIQQYNEFTAFAKEIRGILERLVEEQEKIIKTDEKLMELLEQGGKQQ